MLSFIVCSFWYFIYLAKEKKSFYILHCCGQQAMGLLSTFSCASLRFSVVFAFFNQGKHKSQTSLLDSNWNMYLAHTFFASKCTLIDEYRTKNNLVYMKCFCSQFGVCRCLQILLLCFGWFYFWFNIFVTVLQSAHYGIIVNMKGCKRANMLFENGITQLGSPILFSKLHTITTDST